MKHTSLLKKLLCSALMAWSAMASAKYNLLFTTEQKLPNSLIDIVAEDQDEMIWVSTEDGLCRFDGLQFETYTHDDNNPNSLASNIVRIVFVDRKGHVLVGTNGGLQCFRKRTNDFTPVIVDEETGIKTGNVQDLTELPNGDVFVTGNYTFSLHFDEQDIPHAIPNQFTSQLHMSHQCCVDGKGEVWVVKYNDFLYHLNPQGKLEKASLSIESPGFSFVRTGSDGNLYLGGLTGGLYRYDPSQNKFQVLTQKSESWLVRDVCPIPGTQQMYVCTDGDGVKQLDCTTGQISPVTFDDIQVDAATQKVHSLIISKRGDIWMALYQKGIFVVAHEPLEFHYYGPKSLHHNCIGERCVTSLSRAKDGNLWVATDNGGLYGVSKEGRTIAHYECTSYGGLLPSSLMRLYEDRKGRMWFGSYRQGGGIVDLNTGAVNYIPIEGEEMKSMNIYDYIEDKRNQLWVASMGKGILQYDEQKQRFVKVKLPLPCDWTGVLNYDVKRDMLLAGTYDGLYGINLSKKPYDAKPLIADKVIYSVQLYNDSLYCLCTNLGLLLLNNQTGNVSQYTIADGLPSNNTYATQMDDDGNLWVSSVAGLTKFNLAQRTISNFTVQDGMQSCEFYKNTSWKDADGTLWFGGTAGITFFNPRTIHREKEICTPRIIRLTSGRKKILPNEDGTYELSSDVHAFSVELGTLPILQTRTATYRYSLDDDRWQLLPTSANTMSFSHIISGKHILRFQVVDESGSSEVQEVRINIAYPWFARWWAMLLWLLLAAIIIILAVRHFLELKREKHRMRVKARETAINEAKLQFFMNIAHDFRTPMTLVVSPLQTLMSMDKDPQRQRSYQLMNRNANRVLVLINELMDLRKIDKAEMRLQCRPTSPGLLLKELCDSVSDLTQNRRLTLTLEDHFPADRKGWIDPDCYEKVIVNLLSNAIKYTPKGGSIHVSCELLEGDLVKVSVTDTGIGIPEKDREHIFERFYQVRQHASSMGTGIGLNLVHSLVNLHHGSIDVGDNPAGQGTRFSFVVPIGDSAYTEAEKYVKVNDVTPKLEQAITNADMLKGAMQEVDVQTGSQGNKSHRHVLIVDDDEEVLDYLVQELKPNYRVSACHNGNEALNRLQGKEKFDLVVSDVMMPGMDGLELCRRIRGNVLLNHLPIVLLTAKSTEEDKLQSLDLGANAFISKPFNMELLQKTIANLLGLQDRLRTTYSGQQLPVDKVKTPTLQSPDERLLERILKVVNENLSNPDLMSEDIAREVGLSRVHLYRKLKELTNQSVRNYIRNIRLAKAAELLSHKKMSVAEVAYQVGFDNPNYFATAFKEMYGVSPSAYMEKQV